MFHYCPLFEQRTHSMHAVEAVTSPNGQNWPQKLLGNTVTRAMKRSWGGSSGL